MIAEPRARQRSTAMPLMLIFIGSLVLIAPAVAVSQGPPAKPGANVLPACASVPFVCYTAKHAGDSQFTLLTKLDNLGQCPPCKKCGKDATLTLDDDTGRLMIDCDPTEMFCKEGDTRANCIKSVPLERPDAAKDHWVIFPQNLCTRAMVASGQCADKRPVSAIQIEPWKLGTGYVVQCDAGLTIPEVLGTVVRSEGHIPCIPSLHQFAGLGKDDAKMFVKEDVYPTALTAAGQWNSYEWCPVTTGSQPENCLPRPLRGSKYYVQASTPEARAKFLLPEPTMFASPCDYKSHRYADDNCVPLELQVDAKIYTAGRLKSPPYAKLLSTEDTINMLWRAPPTTGDEEEKTFWYPKCLIVDKDKLLEHQLYRFERNIFLDCTTNPFYKNAQAGDKEKLAVKVEKCGKADDVDWNFCLDIVEVDLAKFEKTILRAPTADASKGADGPPLYIRVTVLTAVVVGGIIFIIMAVRFWEAVLVARKAEADDRRTAGTFKWGTALDREIGWSNGWADPLDDDHEERMTAYNKPIRRVSRFMLWPLSTKAGAERADVEDSDAAAAMQDALAQWAPKASTPASAPAATPESAPAATPESAPAATPESAPAAETPVTPSAAATV